MNSSCRYQDAPRGGPPPYSLQWDEGRMSYDVSSADEGVPNHSDNSQLTHAMGLIVVLKMSRGWVV